MQHSEIYRIPVFEHRSMPDRFNVRFRDPFDSSLTEWERPPKPVQFKTTRSEFERATMIPLNLVQRHSEVRVLAIRKRRDTLIARLIEEECYPC
jgi:hypothetical protein